MGTVLRGLVLVGGAFCILCAGRSALGFDMAYESVTLGVRPYVDASATYDSNAKLTTADKESDVYWQTQVGVSLSLIYKWLTVNGAGYTFSRTYSSTSPKDEESFSGGERFDISFGRRDKLLIGLNQSYERVTDYSKIIHPTPLAETQPGQTELLQQDWSERTRRDVARAGVTLGRDLTDKTEADIGYTYSKDHYLEGGLYDTARHDGQLMLGYKVTDKSSAFFDGRYGSEDSQGYEAPGSDAYAGLGWRTRMTEKVQFDGSAGYETYRSGTLKGRNEKSDVDTIGMHLGGAWRPVDKLTVGIVGQREVEAAVIEANTRVLTLVALTTGYRLKDDLTCSLALSYRRDEYDLPPPGGTEARRLNSEGVCLSTDYSPFRRLTFYAATSYENTQSNLPDEDFDQVRATIGARASF